MSSTEQAEEHASRSEEAAVAFNTSAASDRHEAMAEALHTDRLIEIYVGDVTSETKPFRIQKQLLETLSAYFSKALRASALQEGQTGKLHFPEDDMDVWRVGLLWAIKRSSSVWSQDNDEPSQSLLIRCWVLGDKYRMLSFQDEIMVDLLRRCSRCTSYETVELGIKLTSPGSKLRRLMIEELVCLVYRAKSVTYKDLDALDGHGFFCQFLEIKDRYLQKKKICTIDGRFGPQTPGPLHEGSAGFWREYLVGSEPPFRRWR